MKVILLQDVAKLGRRFEIVETPAGYAQNKLIPQGLAQEATPQNVKRVEAQRGKVAAELANASADFTAALAALEDKTIEVSAETNEQGHLFQAVKSNDISSALATMGVNVSAGQIDIATPIKSVGEHEVTLTSGDQHKAVTVNVVAK